jgi:hypothetical protein
VTSGFATEGAAADEAVVEFVCASEIKNTNDDDREEREKMLPTINNTTVNIRPSDLKVPLIYFFMCLNTIPLNHCTIIGVSGKWEYFFSNDKNK